MVLFCTWFAVEQERGIVEGALADLVRQLAMPSAPEVSLREGRWVKLICGASFEVTACFTNEKKKSRNSFMGSSTLNSTNQNHLSMFPLQDVVDIRNLSLVYTLAGGETSSFHTCTK